MRSEKRIKPWLLAIALTSVISLIALSPVSGASPLNLGIAGKYQILAGTALTVGAGAVGIEPQFDGISMPAVADLQAAIAGAGALNATPVAADLGGNTFGPGIYSALGGAAFAMTGNVVLDGRGEIDPIFLFFTPAAMNTTADVVISLINGAQPKDIYWVVGGAITTGASGVLAGTFMSSAAITTGASNILSGCLLSAAAVTIGAVNTFTGCSQSDVVVPTGALSISVPTSYQIPDSIDGITASGFLGTVTVADSRSGGSAISWIVSVSSTPFTNQTGDLIPASSIAYSITQLQTTGGIVPTTTNRESLTSSLPILSVNGAGGVNSATWLAQIVVTIPLNQAAGSYSGTLTHSVY
jgi:hypothetical protein